MSATLACPAPTTPWTPGDPLHRHPRERRDPYAGAARPMLQILDDGCDAVPVVIRFATPAVCPSCDVRWADPDAPCFVCQQPGRCEQ